MLYLVCHNILTCHMLTSFAWLPFSVSPHFLYTRPLRIAPCASSQSFFLFPASSIPIILITLRHLPCRPLAFSILLRLIAFQNGFVLAQQRPHESFPRAIPLLLRNSNRLHRFIPRFLIHGFRPSNEINRLYFPSFLRHNSSDNLQKICILLCRSFITSLYIPMLPV